MFDDFDGFFSFWAWIVLWILIELRLFVMRSNFSRKLDELDTKTRWLYERLTGLQTRTDQPVATPVNEATPKEGAVPPALTLSTQEAVVVAPVPESTPAPKPIIALPTTPTSPAPEPMTSAPYIQPVEEQSALARLLFTGNILAKIGVLLLIFGVGSALKLAIEYQILPAETYLGLAALFAVALGGFGWKKRNDHPMFGLALQGGGVAILYLVVYFALSRFTLIGTTTAFILFTVLCIAGLWLAAAQNGLSLAALSQIGAFFAPILAASDTGNPVVLFSYYTLLNIFIFILGRLRSWHMLNLAGFLLTFVIGLNWGIQFYQAEDFLRIEPFLIVLYLMYSTLPLLNTLHAARQGAGIHRIDAILIFGTPVVCAFLQTPMVESFEYGLAWSAALAGLHYLGLALIASRRQEAALVLLTLSLRGTGFALLTLAVPFAFGVRATVTLWALEGAAIVWFGARKQSTNTVLTGILLQWASGCYFLLHLDEIQAVTAFGNDIFIGGLLIAAGGLISAHAVRRLGHKGVAHPFGILMLIWSSLWLYGTGLHEISSFVDRPYRFTASLALITLPLIAAEITGRRLGWNALRGFSTFLPIILILSVFGVWFVKPHPFADAAGVVWLLALTGHFVILRCQESDRLDWMRSVRHTFGFWVLAALASSEVSWQIKQLWPEIRLAAMLGWGLAPALLLAAALKMAPKHWPVSPHGSSYTGLGALPIVLALAGWSLVLNMTYSGAAGHWPYVPLLNPLDLAQLTVLATLLSWTNRQDGARGAWRAVLSGLTFFWISAGAARAVHHWLGIPFAWDALTDSVALQASWSLLWTLLAISLMILASRRRQRGQWFLGFCLLGVVGMKLMLVDTAHVNTLARTVSLIGVALLVIAASYFSPTPPRAQSD